MPSSVEDLVREIHDAAREFVITLSGGGVVGLADLLTMPGASRTVLKKP